MVRAIVRDFITRHPLLLQYYDVDDLCQECWGRIHARGALEAYDSTRDTKFTSWVGVIASRVLTDMWRRALCRPIFVYNESPVLSASTFSASEYVGAKDLLEQMRKYLSPVANAYVTARLQGEDLDPKWTEQTVQNRTLARAAESEVRMVLAHLFR